MIIVCVAVRLKSRRLPKKALADLHGEPLILRLTRRIEKAGYPVVWCTSTHKQDNALDTLARWHNIECFRGSELDVMDRFIQVATLKKAKTIVRVTGDNPLTDPALLRVMLQHHKNHNAHYTYVDGPPRGTKPEIIDVQALRNLHLSVDKSKTEYMTHYLHLLDHKVEVKLPNEWNRPELRLTVDEREDLERVRKIYDHFNGHPPDTKTILQYLDESGLADPNLGAEHTQGN